MRNNEIQSWSIDGALEHFQLTRNLFSPLRRGSEARTDCTINISKLHLICFLLISNFSVSVLTKTKKGSNLFWPYNET
jgi:hypothetical protein